MLGRGFACADCGSGSFIIKGARVVHDEPSHARGRFEPCQLRHGGNDPARSGQRCGFDDPKKGF